MILTVADTDDADSWMFMFEATSTGEMDTGQWPEFFLNKSGFILSFSTQDYWHGLTLKYLYYIKSEIQWYLL